MRVLVTGSRDWTGVYGEARIHEVLDSVHTLAEILNQTLTIVHGDGPGADQVIDAWAVRREDSGVTVERHPARWGMGTWAGPIRNQHMISQGADMCIGFLRGSSRGTSMTLEAARNKGIPTYTVHWTEEERPDEYNWGTADYAE